MNPFTQQLIFKRIGESGKTVLVEEMLKIRLV